MKKNGRTGLRKEILDAARALLLEDGVKNLSMRKIAAQIGCKAPSIYYHFEGKSDLMHALVVEGHNKLYSAMETAVSEHEDPLAQMEAHMRAYVTFGLENPVYYEIMFLLGSEESGFDYRESFREARKSQDLAISALSEAASRGWIKDEDFREVTSLIGISLHGYVTLALHYGSRSPFHPKETLDNLIDKIFLGIHVGGRAYDRKPLNEAELTS